MKKIIFTILIIFLSLNKSFAQDFDYMQIYRDLEVPNFSFVHNIDPGQYYEMKGMTWSPYPLFRLNSPLHFKSITIPPGYYNLTPREHKGSYYILFKESGLVRFIIPVYEKDFVPEYFYEEHLPKPKLSFTQKVQIKTLDFIGKVFPSAKRKPIPQSYLEVTDLDNNFVSIVIYYKEFKYSTIFRTVKL